MKSLISKRLIYRLTKFRIFAIAFVLGVLGFWIWQLQTKTPQNSTVFVVEFPPTPTPVPQTVVEDRKLSEYEQLEISNCVGVTDSEYRDCVNSLDRGREFIVKHWKEKRRAYIIYIWCGVDVCGDTHFFIEPDSNANWQVVIRRKRYYTVVGWENLFKVESEEAISVKRKKEKKNLYSYHSGEFYLQFLDKNGEEVDTL
jgi:hypothetical protein